MCQFKEFKEKLITLISNNFNINLYGPNGCGKTRSILDLIKENKLIKIPFLYLKLSDFIDLEKVLEKIKSFIIEKLTSQDMKMREPDSTDELEYSLDEICEIKLRKFCDLYEIFELAGEFIINTIIIIDQIDDVNFFSTSTNNSTSPSQVKINKYFKKFLSLCENFEIKLFLISNFDMKNSECKSDMDLSSFISVIFPKLEISHLKEIICEDLKNSKENKNFEAFSQRTYEKKAENKSRCENLLNFSILNFQTCTVNLNKLKINTQEVLKEFLDYDDYEYMFTSNLRKKVKSQIKDKLYVDQNRLYDEEEDEIKICNKFTEALSKCQKLLVISAFVAGESEQSRDHKIFKCLKKTDLRIRRTFSGRSLINKNEVIPFTIHRLVSIYSALVSIVHGENGMKIQDLNVEFFADLNTLISFNLLKYIQAEKLYIRGGSWTYNQGLDVNKKMISNINFVLADFLCGEFDLRLEDFLKMEFFY
jgi:hypothetical protein